LFSRNSSDSHLEPELVCVVDTLPTVFVLLHDVLMGEDVIAAGTTFEVSQSVMLARIGFDNSEVIAGTFRTGCFHESRAMK